MATSDMGGRTSTVAEWRMNPRTASIIVASGSSVGRVQTSMLR